MEFVQPRVELSPINRAEISPLDSIQKPIKSNAWLHGKICNPGLSSTPGLKFQPSNLKLERVTEHKQATWNDDLKDYIAEHCY